MILRRAAIASLVVFATGILTAEVVHVMLRQATAADPAIQFPGKYFGAGTCDGPACHTKAAARAEPPALQEFTAWSAVDDKTGIPFDRHSYAFKRLKLAPSAAIQKKLNAIENTKDTAVDSERCLTCHGVSIHDYGVGHNNPGAAVGKHKEAQGGKFVPADGVSCDGCHGPAEKWFKKHDKKNWTLNEWNKDGGKNGGSQKLYDDNGIYFSKDLELWANQCVRCHLALDTNLLDAGHPDLNPFELYGQSIPSQHWRDYSQAKPSPELPGAGPFHAANLWETGQTAALRSSLEQIAKRARDDKAKPEYLQNAVDRAIGHWTVLRQALVLMAADASKALDEAMGPIKTPGTKPEDLAAAADKALAVVKPLTRKAADFDANIGHVNAVLKAIATDPAVLENQRAAEQAEKAFYALDTARLTATNPAALTADPPTDPIMKAVFAMGDPPDVKADAFKKALEEIKAALK